MFPHGNGPHASRARVGRAAGSPITRPSWRATTAGPSPSSTGPATPWRAHLVAQGVGPGDRVAVMTSNRPEFVVAVHAVQQARCGRRPAELGLEGARGRHAARPDRAPLRRRRRAGVGLLSERLGADARPRPRRRRRGRRRSTAPAPRRRPASTVRESDDAVLVFSSGTTDRPKAVRHTHRSIALGTAHWVLALGLGHDDRFQVATPPSHILGPAEPAGRGGGRRHRPPAPSLRPRRGAPLHRGRSG